MIIDNHMHIFPHLGGASGFDSVAEHMKHLQLQMCGYTSPHRRVSDQVIVMGTLWDDNRSPSYESLYDVNFRVGDFGRCIWTYEGVDYYIQKFPPSMQVMEAPPGLALAQMDYAGVDMAILHNQNYYGFLNEYIGDACKRYPDRFIGLAQVHEEEAYTPREIERLRHAVEELGLRGLYFAPGNHDRNPDYLHDSQFKPFWDEVKRLGIVVYLSVDWRGIAAWIRRYPDVQVMMGFPDANIPREGSIRIPQAVDELLSLPNVLSEICPIGYGARYEYPYTEMQPIIRPLYDAFGGEKFVWGSDLPNLERWCTYSQGIDFLRRHCTFISKSDMDLILGGNLARVHNIAPRAKPGRGWMQMPGTQVRAVNTA